jgi:hypothetical protein
MITILLLPFPVFHLNRAAVVVKESKLNCELAMVGSEGLAKPQILFTNCGLSTKGFLFA